MDYFLSRRFLGTLPDWETGAPPSGPLENYLPRMRALLQRLDHPQQHYTTIIVGGTNGKGTVASLLAALLQAAGHRVGLYTSPHLHTLRERIRLNGQISSKDQWTEGVSRLYDKSRDFKAEGYGDFSKFEALTALAALLFADTEMEYGIFEVGLGGRFDATNAWDADRAILTSIGLDHVEILGGSLLEIAADKLHIARAGRPLFTTGAQAPEVLDYIRRQSRKQGIPLFLATADRVETPEGIAVAYPWSPVELQGRPCTYLDNARLALAAAAHLLGDQLAADLAARVVREHQWPGRFETARRRPLVLLDGAHNPAAAAALAEDLGALSPQWTFIVGVSAGHDATGILRVLQPLAAQVVLTSSDHPKALDVESLETCAPRGLPVRKEAVCTRAFKEVIAALGPEDHLCILGSLYLIARAREFFNLPYEREGISEDVALESLECIEMACRNRGMQYERVSENGNVLCITGKGRPYYFLRNKHPFNDYVAARLAEDKGYQYELFVRAGLPTPFTMQVFNPLAADRFNRYKTHLSVEEIGEDVEHRFTYPVVVKKYRSSVSQGVYLEHSEQDLKKRLQNLFEHSSYGDNILLIQAYVQGPEFRAMASRDELLLVYEKQSEEFHNQEDLNPLHQASGRAVKVEDPELLQPLQELVRVVAAVLDLGFYAIDLIRAEDGFYILEINPNPFCFFYNRDNGRADFVRIYERLFEKYMEE
jgi:dihydrofolate synthase/folylpolyglutamate synthase